MKKTLLLLSLLLPMTLLTSCDVRETYRLLHNEEEISAISIVRVYLSEEDDLVQTCRVVIDDVDAFLVDFRNVDCYVWFGDPIGLQPAPEGTDVVKIEYRNGDYELIDCNGQTEYTEKRGLVYYAGFSMFDENQFTALIGKYLAADGLPGNEI